MVAKAIDRSSFSSLSSVFNSTLDTIKGEAAKGKKEGASAYAKASSGKAKLDPGPDEGRPVKDANGKIVKAIKGIRDHVEALVTKLTAEQIEWAWKGLEQTTPVDKHANDVITSVTAAWDKAAAKYMKNDAVGGDAERSKMMERLREFDAAISSKGAMPVKKDE